MKKEVKKKKRIIFCLICLTIIVSIFTFYIFNYLKTKNINITTTKLDNIRKSDIYKKEDAIIYKGINPNNYLLYSNILWRIISINSDGSLEIVTSDYINILKNNNNNINKYLNDIFIKNLTKTFLEKTSYCSSPIDDIKTFKCNNITTSDYVRLISVEEVINSISEEKSYLLNNYDYWLNNKTNDQNYAIINEKITKTSPSFQYPVRPVVRLSKNIQIKTGNGTIETPYQIVKEEEKLTLGSYILLDEDLWIVYDIENKQIGLSLAKSLPGLKTFGKTNEYNPNDQYSIAYYLNNDYLNSLSYKNIINNHAWNISSYQDNYKQITKKKVKSKVGLLSITDIKFNKENQYLITPNEQDEIYIYNYDIPTSKTNYARKITPTIYINNSKISSGLGTKDNPYIMEVLS